MAAIVNSQHSVTVAGLVLRPRVRKSNDEKTACLSQVVVYSMYVCYVKIN